MMPKGNVYVAESAEKALSQYREVNPHGKMEDLGQDEDCLDTWFSSWSMAFRSVQGIFKSR
jgi:valyl-tRNA synthetase